MSEESKVVSMKPPQASTAGLSAQEALVSKESYKDEAWWRWDAMIKGGAVGKTETPATCIAKAAFGELYGWPPILAVNRVYLVDGRPCLASEAMLGLIRERMPKAKIVKVHHDEGRCVIKAKRDPEDEDWHVVEWTIDDARRAGLLSKSNWKHYPKQMNYWRAVSMLSRELFSDITLGAHTPEELSERESVRQLERPKSDILDDLINEIDDPREVPIVDAEHDDIEPERTADGEIADYSPLLEASMRCELCNERGGHQPGCPDEVAAAKEKEQT